MRFYLFPLWDKNATCAVSRFLFHRSCVGQYRLKFTVTPDPTLWKFWWYIFVDTWNNSKTNNSKWATNILPDRGLGVLVRKYGDGEIVCWMCDLLVVVGGLVGLERCHLEGCYEWFEIGHITYADFFHYSEMLILPLLHSFFPWCIPVAGLIKRKWPI